MKQPAPFRRSTWEGHFLQLELLEQYARVISFVREFYIVTNFLILPRSSISMRTTRSPLSNSFTTSELSTGRDSFWPAAISMVTCKVAGSISTTVPLTNLVQSGLVLFRAFIQPNPP